MSSAAVQDQPRSQAAARETASEHEAAADTVDEDRDNDVKHFGEAPRRASGESQRSEDPPTMEAREELKATTISDRVEDKEKEGSVNEEADVDKEMKDNEPPAEEKARVATPEQDKPDTAGTTALAPKEKKDPASMMSPKKKRSREADEDVEAAALEDEGSSESDGKTNGKTRGLAPMKKRARDKKESSDETVPLEEKSIKTSTTTAPVKKDDSSSNSSTPEKPAALKKPQTSQAAFSASGFASLAQSTTSPFGAIGASQSSVFGSSAGKPASASGFGGLASSSGSSTSTGVFGGALGAKAPGSDTKPLSSFASATGTIPGGSVFGGGFSSAFAGGAGSKLSSFAAPTAAGTGIIGAEKAAKPFGAPESDGSDDEEDEGSSDEAGEDDAEKEEKPEENEKKKIKLSQAPPTDGEEGEATLLSFRAKLFHFESKEVGWKERGAGTLKLNVPENQVSYDHHGNPMPGTFFVPAASEQDDEESGEKSGEKKTSAAGGVPRLVMRQDSTHRVILNTAIAKNISFQENSRGTNMFQVMFTAMDAGVGVKNFMMRLKEENLRLFLAEVKSIQDAL